MYFSQQGNYLKRNHFGGFVSGVDTCSGYIENRLYDSIGAVCGVRKGGDEHVTAISDSLCISLVASAGGLKGCVADDGSKVTDPLWGVTFIAVSARTGGQCSRCARGGLSSPAVRGASSQRITRARVLHVRLSSVFNVSVLNLQFARGGRWLPRGGECARVPG